MYYRTVGSIPISLRIHVINRFTYLVAPAFCEASLINLRTILWLTIVIQSKASTPNGFCKGYTILFWFTKNVHS